jgi:hypothetical protein
VTAASVPVNLEVWNDFFEFLSGAAAAVLALTFASFQFRSSQ